MRECPLSFVEALWVGPWTVEQVEEGWAVRQARDGETCAVVEFHETALLLAAALPIARRPAAYGNRRDALMMVFGDRGYSTVGQMPGIEMALGPLNTLHHLLCLPSSLAHLLRAAGPDILALVGAEMR